MSNRDDARSADKSERRLDAYERVDVRRRHDRAIGLRAHGNGGKIRRHGDAGSGTRSGRVAIERVRVPGLTAASAPSTRRVCRSEVGPLTEIGLSQNDGAARPQSLDDEGV